MSISIIVETYAVLSTIAVALLALTAYNTHRRGIKKGSRKTKAEKSKMEFAYIPEQEHRSRF